MKTRFRKCPYNSPHYTQSRIQKPNQVLLSSKEFPDIYTMITHIRISYQLQFYKSISGYSRFAVGS